MNFIFTLIALIISAIVISGITIFVLNLISRIVFVLLDNKTKINARYLVALGLLTIIHSYVWLSFLAILILLNYSCTSDSRILLTINWIITSIISLTGTWIAYNQAKQKLNDVGVRKYESFHTNGLGLNALISSIGFIVLAIFPSTITSYWGWLEQLFHKVI